MSPTEIEKARDSMGLSSIESVLSEAVSLPDEQVPEINSAATHVPMKKILLSILAGLAVIIVIGFLLPVIFPSCNCELGGCKGCGGPVGNAIGSFAVLIVVLGAMGFLLLIWFGIPVAILGLIVYGLFKLFRKKTESQ